MAVPSPVGDVKIVSPISTFVLNTLKQYQLKAMKHTYQLRGMASTLRMRTTISPEQWQPWTAVSPLLSMAATAP